MTHFCRVQYHVGWKFIRKGLIDGNISWKTEEVSLSFGIALKSSWTEFISFSGWQLGMMNTCLLLLQRREWVELLLSLFYGTQQKTQKKKAFFYCLLLILLFGLRLVGEWSPILGLYSSLLFSSLLRWIRRSWRTIQGWLYSSKSRASPESLSEDFE